MIFTTLFKLPIYAHISIIIVCILSAAIFSGIETGLLSLSRIKLRHLVKIRKESAAKIDRLIGDMDSFLIMVSSGDVISIVLGVLFASLLISKLLNHELEGTMLSFILTISMTLIFLIFSQIIPKAIFYKEADTLLYRFASLTYILYLLLTPLIYPIKSVLWILSKPFGRYSVKQSTLPSKDEIRMLVKQGKAQGVLEDEETTMIHNIFEAAQTQIGNMMVPLTNIVAVDFSADIKGVKKIAQQSGHTRLPVYKKRIDNIIGILNIYDVLYSERKDWTRHIRKPSFVPKFKIADDLVKELLQRREFMAIVVDEFGGCIGIVTIEDLMEEVVGEIYDENEIINKQLVTIDQNTMEVKGDFPMNEAEKVFELDLSNPNYDTISGFIMSRLLKIPRMGDSVSTDKFTFRVMKMDGRRIEKIRVTRLK